MNLTQTKEGTIIEVYVKPNAPRFQVAVNEEEIIVYSTEEPEKGRVNRELVKNLSKLFQARVDLVAGATSRQKRFLVEGLAKDKLEEMLRKLSTDRQH